MPAVAARLRAQAADHALTVTLAALLAAHGDGDAVAWLRAQPRRLARLGHGNGWVLIAAPTLLPADLAAQLPRASAAPAARSMSDAEMRAALTRMRRQGLSDAVDLLCAGRCRDEASWMLTHARVGGARTAVATIGQAGVGRLLTTWSLRELRASPDPLVRRVAASWGSPPEP